VSNDSVTSEIKGPVAETKAGYLRSAAIPATVPSTMVRHQIEAEATSQPSELAATAPAAVASAEVSPTGTPAPRDAFFTHQIQPGETVYSIADLYGIDADYILWNNPEVGLDPNLLLVGANLLIPSINGIAHHVTYGDSLWGVADYYGADINQVLAVNGLSDADTIVEGMVLMIPGAVPPAPVYEEPVYDEPVFDDSGSGGGFGGPALLSAPLPPASTGYIWPFYGNITTYFGGYYGHKGIDLDGVGAYGAPIAAAADGIVILASYDEWGLGLHVVVQHSDGSMTKYAHLSEIWVGQGEYVSQGQAVGALGSTGYSTGAHLHFELWIGGGPVDPLAYLP
jgi:murein DD-endopeptidase MepM/ murein hydrolase activator NlpD